MVDEVIGELVDESGKDAKIPQKMTPILVHPLNSHKDWSKSPSMVNTSF